MKKKMIFAGIAILILVWLFIYFRPIQLSNSVSENNTILISVSKLGVRDGAAYVDSTDYKDITDEQKAILYHCLKAIPTEEHLVHFFQMDLCREQEIN